MLHSTCRKGAFSNFLPPLPLSDTSRSPFLHMHPTTTHEAHTRVRTRVESSMLSMQRACFVAMDTADDGTTVRSDCFLREPKAGGRNDMG